MLFLQLTTIYDEKIIINTDKICSIRYSKDPVSYSYDYKNPKYLLNIYTTDGVITVPFLSSADRWIMIQKLEAHLNFTIL